MHDIGPKHSKSVKTNGDVVKFEHDPGELQYADWSDIVNVTPSHSFIELQIISLLQWLMKTNDSIKKFAADNKVDDFIELID